MIDNRKAWNKIWRAYAGSWYRPRTITNAPSDVSTGKLLNEAGFGQTSGRQSHSISDARRHAQFITDGDREASSTRKLLPQHVASLCNYPKQMGVRRRYGDSSCVSGWVDSQICIFDDASREYAICIYFVTFQHFLDFSDQIVRQDYSSVCVQGSYGPCVCSRHQIKLIDKQWTVYGVACYR